MAIENINVGALPNDGSGDAVRVAFGKVNNNFNEVVGMINAVDVSNMDGGSATSTYGGTVAISGGSA